MSETLLNFVCGVGLKCQNFKGGLFSVSRMLCYRFVRLYNLDVIWPKLNMAVSETPTSNNCDNTRLHAKLVRDFRF